MVSGAWIPGGAAMKNPVFPLLLALVLPLQACATKYSAEPIQAWVVDIESNQPIEGVVVVAHWQLEGGLEGGSNIGQMMVLESVTGKDGRFSFPAWGPKEIPSGLSIWHRNARLKNLDPEMLLFKSGYEYLGLQNNKSLDEVRGERPYVRTSDWNGKTIRMKKFKGNLHEYAEHLSNLSRALNYVTDQGYNATALEYGYCEWKKIPLMINAIGKQTKIFREANIRDSTFYSHLATNEEYLVSKGCGSVKEFLKEHEK